MATILPLDRMSKAEKLRALEELWEDLSRNPEAVPAPGWHGDELRRREKRAQDGTASFVDWETVKERLRTRTR